MTPAEYRALRESVGGRPKVAKLLDVSVASLIKREDGRQRVRREAEMALRWAAMQEQINPTPEFRAPGHIHLDRWKL